MNNKYVYILVQRNFSVVSDPWETFIKASFNEDAFKDYMEGEQDDEFTEYYIARVFLEALEKGGVRNWEWYEESISDYQESND